MVAKITEIFNTTVGGTSQELAVGAAWPASLGSG